jgi:NAD(P)-dependent dehydrogenase (short-subunit alcohol dehydrogenase family)
MPFRKKRTILVTGAAGGIGGACVNHLLHEGFNVCAADLRPLDVDEAHADALKNLQLEQVDISRQDSCEAVVEAAIKRFGRLDGLIHMAGVHCVEPWEELTAESFNRILSINVAGTFLIARAAALGMAKTGGGAIVLASSGSTNLSREDGTGNSSPAFVASKSAIIGLVGALARSFAPLHVRVNAVSPGATDTAMSAHFDEHTMRTLSERSLAGRIGAASEIARVAAFLVSNAASYVDAQVIAVNGGDIHGS